MPTATTNFVATANETHVVYDVGRAQEASGGPLAASTLKYDADTDSLTLKTASDELVFLTSDRSITADNFLRYEKEDGSDYYRLDLRWNDMIRPDWTAGPSYVALGKYMARHRDVPTGIDSYRSIAFVFGYPTDVSIIPRSGTAAYQLDFVGSRSSPATAYLLDIIGGSGMAVVDFGSSEIEISGNIAAFNYLGPGIAGTDSDGKIHASGIIDTSENNFSGTFTATGGPDTYAGDFTGSFYGPKSEEIGGTFYGTSGPLFFSVAFAGFGLPNTLPDDTLANLTGITRFRTVGTYVDLPAYENLWNALGENVTYNANTQTYEVNSSSQAGFGFSFGNANRMPEKDAGDLRAYGAAQPILNGKVQYSIDLFDGETDGIELTYTSFLRVFATKTNTEGDVEAEGLEYIGFGKFTPPNQMPRSGSATYAGRLFGDLYDDTRLIAGIRGRSELSANFSTGALTASLFPERINAGGSATALGQYDFTGSINTFMPGFTGLLDGGSGYLFGRFYGDVAQEYGAVFRIDDPVAGKMTGISVGRRE